VRPPAAHAPTKASSSTLRSRLLVEALLVLALLVALVVPLQDGLPDKQTSPDENAFRFFVQNFAETGRLSYPEPLSEGTHGLVHPRSAVTNDRGDVVPLAFPGSLIVDGTVQVLVPGGAKVVGVGCLLASALLVMGLTRRIAGHAAATAAGLFLVAIPAFVYYAIFNYSTNIVGLCFFSLLAFFAWATVQEGHARLLLAAGIAGTMAAVTRYDLLPAVMIVLAVPGLRVLLHAWRGRHFVLAPTIALAGLLPALGIFALNTHLYGSPLSTGYNHLAVEAGENTDQLSTLSLLTLRGVRFDALLDMIRAVYGRSLLPLVALGMVALPFHIRAGLRSPRLQVAMLAAFFASTLYLLLFNSQLDVYEGFTGKVESSIVRYLMPTFGLAAVFGAGFFATGAAAPRTKVLAVVVVFLAMAANLPDTHASIEEKRTTMDQYVTTSQHFQRLGGPDAVFFSGYWSKIIFPERKVATFYGTTNVSDIADAMVHLNTTGREVLYVDDGIVSRTRVAGALDANGYTLNMVDSVTHTYRLARS